MKRQKKGTPPASEADGAQESGSAKQTIRLLSPLSNAQKRWRERHPEQWRAIGRNWRERNREKVRAKAREWRERNREKLRAKGRRWRERNLERIREYKRRWIKANSYEIRARNKITKAIRAGRLERQPCEVCGNLRSHAHHDDYFRPLEVRWLCAKHHGRHHADVRLVFANTMHGDERSSDERGQ